MNETYAVRLLKDIGMSCELTLHIRYIVLNRDSGRFRLCINTGDVIGVLKLWGGQYCQEDFVSVKWSDGNIEIIDLKNGVVYHLIEFLSAFDPSHEFVPEGATVRPFVPAKMFSCNNIVWDTDEEVFPDLPTQVAFFEDDLIEEGYVEAGCDDEAVLDILADVLSDRYGWCVKSFSSEVGFVRR